MACACEDYSSEEETDVSFPSATTNGVSPAWAPTRAYGEAPLKVLDDLIATALKGAALPAAEPLPQVPSAPFEASLRTLDTLMADVAKLAESEDNYQQLQRVKKAARETGLSTAQFVMVPKDYYEWDLERRRERIGAISTEMLCKSLILENTACTRPDCSDRNNSRFYCIIVQYVAQISSQKIFKFVRSLCPDSRKDDYHFRMADAEEARKLTGFEFNAVCPVGMAQPMPVIMAEPIARLQWLWLGGGQVDLKLGCMVSDFVRQLDPFVTDIYK
eukprot:m51a1_g14715 putative rho guanine nucleotide exchange (274) ;mRNA; r:169313-170266